jgi:hypothetical protein
MYPRKPVQLRHGLSLCQQLALFFVERRPLFVGRSLTAATLKEGSVYQTELSFVGRSLAAATLKQGSVYQTELHGSPIAR